MIAATVVLLLARSNAQEIFDSAIAARIRLTTYSVQVQTDTTVPGKHEQVTFNFSTMKSTSLLRLREPATQAVDRSDRSILLTQDKLTAYDAVANEYLTRSNKENGSVTTRLVSVLGPLPDALTLALDPATMKNFFAQFRLFRDWSISKNGSTTTLLRRSKDSETMFRFEGAQPLLSEVMIRIPKSKLHWMLHYQSAVSLGLHIPKDANQVYTFTVKAAPPKFANAAAKSVVDKMTKAYAGLKFGVVEVASKEGTSHLYMGGRRLKEDRATFVWSYDGTILSVFNKRTKQFYQGKAPRPLIAEYVVEVGCEVDPIIRKIVANRVPFGDLFPTQATVALKGAVDTGNGMASIIQISKVNPSTALFVREDNHLLDSLESVTVDRRGRILSESKVQYRYSSLGEMPRGIAFSVESGRAKALPLPEIKIMNQ